VTKVHPGWALDTIEGWSLENKHTAWIAKHALRSLIKQGDLRALTVIGAGAKAEVELLDVRVEPAVVRLGEAITLSFVVKSTVAHEQRLVIDYAIDYVKANGGVSGKVFKLKTVVLVGFGSEVVGRRQVIRDFTTRKHHSGPHTVHVTINGKVLDSCKFELRT
jgi:hypothetical protein